MYVLSLPGSVPSRMTPPHSAVQSEENNKRNDDNSPKGFSR